MILVTILPYSGVVNDGSSVTGLPCGVAVSTERYTVSPWCLAWLALRVRDSRPSVALFLVLSRPAACHDAFACAAAVYVSVQ